MVVDEVRALIGKRVTITITGGSILQNCWPQHDGSFVVRLVYLNMGGQDSANAYAYVDGCDVTSAIVE